MSSTTETENSAIYSMRTLDFEAQNLELSAEIHPEAAQSASVSALSREEAPFNEASTEHHVFSAEHRFEQESILGTGAYGEVWLVHDRIVERPVAVKKLVKSDTQVQENVKREASLGARVAHPGTPTIYDIGVDENGQFRVIMEYMEGEGLDKIIKRLRNGDPQTLEEYPFHVRAEMLAQLLRVLVAAHQKQIVHSDIKPANILVGPSKEVFLCDWGIAFDLNEGPRTRILGTPNFMAPEQITLKDLDTRADLFGVAALAYLFLSLHDWHPYTLDLKKYMTEKLTHQAKPVDRVFHTSQGYTPSEYKAWVHKGLSSNPLDRHQNAVEMLKELEDIQNGVFCVVCPRTMVKHWVHRYLKSLDRNPELIFSVTAVSFLAFSIALVVLGMQLS